ncbi:MAG TPA: polyphosphate polymerase domain-containing protein [Vicinamibacterales bacterium]|nr:polyphosphate polymerase domain-containing protein [Vicinamibacterales bacterium]
MAETAGLHLRETRAHAREIKFVVDAARGPELQAWMRANLAPDEFGSGPEHDQFETSSLYFETAQFDVFHRRGSYGKSKYRVRRYGTSPIMFLERKFRTDRVLIKRRTTAACEDFRRIELDEPDPEWYGYWFHRRLLARRLKPLVQVSYVRTARLGSSPHGKVRMTLDVDLRVLPLPDGAFLPGVGLPLMQGFNIVEVKYCVTLPPIFRQLISQFALQMQPVSKYRAGLALLDLSPKPTQV